ncbi:hypothetical protein ACOSQ3_033076 [Xanthoceras sorbifolium]
MILEEEIGYKNQQLTKLKHDFRGSKAKMLKLIAGLTEKITARDTQSLALEQIYDDKILCRERRLFGLERMFHESCVTVRQLMNEKNELYEEYTKDEREVAKSKTCWKRE